MSRLNCFTQYDTLYRPPHRILKMKFDKRQLPFRKKQSPKTFGKMVCSDVAIGPTMMEKLCLCKKMKGSCRTAFMLNESKKRRKIACFSPQHFKGIKKTSKEVKKTKNTKKIKETKITKCKFGEEVKTTEHNRRTLVKKTRKVNWPNFSKSTAQQKRKRISVQVEPPLQTTSRKRRSIYRCGNRHNNFKQNLTPIRKITNIRMKVFYCTEYTSDGQRDIENPKHPEENVEINEEMQEIQSEETTTCEQLADMDQQFDTFQHKEHNIQCQNDSQKKTSPSALMCSPEASILTTHDSISNIHHTEEIDTEVTLEMRKSMSTMQLEDEAEDDIPIGIDVNSASYNSTVDNNYMKDSQVTISPDRHERIDMKKDCTQWNAGRKLGKENMMVYKEKKFFKSGTMSRKFVTSKKKLKEGNDCEKLQLPQLAEKLQLPNGTTFKIVKMLPEQKKIYTSNVSKQHKTSTQPTQQKTTDKELNNDSEQIASSHKPKYSISFKSRKTQQVTEKSQMWMDRRERNKQIAEFEASKKIWGLRGGDNDDEWNETMRANITGEISTSSSKHHENVEPKTQNEVNI